MFALESGIRSVIVSESPQNRPHPIQGILRVVGETRGLLSNSRNNKGTVTTKPNLNYNPSRWCPRELPVIYLLVMCEWSGREVEGHR